MQNLEVDISSSLIALVLSVIFFLSWIYLRRWERPFLYYSCLTHFESDNRSWRQRLNYLPRQLSIAALALFLLAYIDPHYYVLKDVSDNAMLDPKRIPTEGIAIYLVLDNSRSMSEEIEISTPSGHRKIISKIKILKDITERFVRGDSGKGLKGRPNDLIGLLTFARSAQVLAPLTLDHREIIKQLRDLDVNRDEGQLGTAIGYAVFKTANLIEATRHFGQNQVKEGDPAYEIKNSIILLVTDGFQETNPDDYQNPLRNIDLDDAAKFAKKYGVTLYIVNIDPQINAEKYSNHRKFFQLLTEVTGGKFYHVNSSRDLQDIYSEIDKLEKSELPEHTKQFKDNLPHIYNRVSYHRPLIFLGILCIFFSVVLMSTLLRRFP